jgi:pyridoxine 5-phosphate synthase
MVAAGHGLTYRNIGPLAAIPEITEFNIGHNIISRSIFVGLEEAVREMMDVIMVG